MRYLNNVQPFDQPMAKIYIYDVNKLICFFIDNHNYSNITYTC